MKLKRDDWLASLLGRDAFRVEIEAHPISSSVQELFFDARPGFYYAKIPTQNIDLLNELTKCRFQVVDVNVTLEYTPSQPIELSKGLEAVVCKFDPERHGQVAKIGEQCFTYSRFHLDPQIPNELANRVKREWVENCMAGKRGNGLLVAESNGRVAGFLTVLDRIENDKKLRIIDLVGVDRDFQGRGIGRALVHQFIRDAGADCHALRVGTQAANIPSLRLYESSGFKIVETSYVLHAHR